MRISGKGCSNAVCGCICRLRSHLGASKQVGMVLVGVGEDFGWIRSNLKKRNY